MLGHILLGHMNLNVFFCNYSEENKKLEKEAISFAYELLLPEKEFREYALKYNNSVRCLADIFFVSQAAVLVRLHFLGLL